MPQNQSNKRSPLKQPPPRQAGESVQALMDDFMLDRVFRWLYFPIAFGACSIMFWVSYITGTSIKTIAWTMTALCIVTTPIAYYKIRSAMVAYKKMRQGRDGERVVGAMLEDLRRDGYRVLHDVPNAKKSSFNIDHVVIGPGGVFSIETKTFSKVGTRDEKIHYDCEELVIPGIGRGAAVEDVIHQARAGADFIRKLLTESTGHKIQVQPIVVFPGWYVIESSNPVWVINDKRIFTRIGQAPQRLKREDIALYTQRIRLHIDDCLG